jgi:MoaA/NifB/PqqE/SkfB family radical SAM enzyme
MATLVRDDPIVELPVLFLWIRRNCNHRCATCDIWQYTAKDEITPEDVRGWAAEWERLRVREVILTGGEPLLHSRLDELCEAIGQTVPAVRLLTNGLLLRRRAETVVARFVSARVSLDGPPETHNRLRGVPRAFPALRDGVRRVKALDPSFPIGARCTVQLGNFRSLRETVQTARRLGLDYLSFGATDVSSEAYNRPGGWTGDRAGSVALGEGELDELERELDALERECADEFESGFIREPPALLREVLGGYYRALNGTGEFPQLGCSAPWVSALVEPDGTTSPCFFHRSVGNVRDAGGLAAVVNGEQARAFRGALDMARDDVCRRCTCRMPLYSCTCGWSARMPYCDGVTCGRGAF